MKTINANIHLSHYKSMANLSCHSNQSSYLIGTKNTIIRSPCLQMLCVKYGKNLLHGSRAYYARRYMSKGMIHIQLSFREFVLAFNKFLLVKTEFQIQSPVAAATSYSERLLFAGLLLCDVSAATGPCIKKSTFNQS